MDQSSDVDMNVQSTDTQDEKEPLLRNANNRGGAFAVIIILVLTFFQYVAYFSVVKNMVGYWHEHLKSTMDNAWLERMLLVGIGQCAALFGGIIADVLLGKRKTLGVGFTFYLLGAMMLEISTVDSQNTSKKSLATASVAFVVLAEACVSPTLAILGATQLTVNEYNCELVMLMFYLLRNCGALLVNYLVTFVFGPAGDGQFWPALAATLAALLLYLVGLRRYKIEKKIEGLTTCGEVWILIKSWRRSSKDRQRHVTGQRRRRREGAASSFKRLVTLILVNSSVFSFSIIYSQV
ncbi:protein NRT1/ PTR FAMILY 5.11-like [Lingula anatina]|uniref:Protein NRT1/ PTR FAMILY 5.11-like n=1 Tax=Lingula anatina TaxID=7574 RepID=A0A1S3IU35_LINAN|nr:protein NRT1/ PTR FAMILY 5.11-like [Lingula anatina]|eukprot:XP_013401049.2 protein NRT1/ PTR FAMILY 5.11-like [Lingula anatina]